MLVKVAMAIGQPLVFLCQVKPSIALGITQERCMLATKPRMTPVAIFVGHFDTRSKPAPTSW
jgi:hypothetical protein